MRHVIVAAGCCRVHFTPTSASWLNQVERFFAEITEKRIRRGVFKTVNFSPTVRIGVASNVRFSIRPCPLSTVVATRSPGPDAGR